MRPIARFRLFTDEKVSAQPRRLLLHARAHTRCSPSVMHGLSDEKSTVPSAARVESVMWGSESSGSKLDKWGPGFPAGHYARRLHAGGGRGAAARHVAMNLGVNSPRTPHSILPHRPWTSTAPNTPLESMSENYRTLS